MHRTYRALYRLGLTPWDSTSIPAPLTATTQKAIPGSAVDLGCGTGHQALYLAARGWPVTALDYVPHAIEAARKNDPGGLVTWRLADVTDLAAVDPDGRLAHAVTLVLDNGCLHGIPDQRRAGWARTIHALAAPGCVLLTHATPRRHRGIGPHGLHPHELSALLGDSWRSDTSPGPDWHLYTHP